MARFQIVIKILSCLPNGQKTARCRVLDVRIIEKSLARQLAGLPFASLDELDTVEQAVDRPSEHLDGRGFDTGAPARVDPVAGHQIHLRSKDLLHPLLECYQIEQCKALRLREIEEDIDVRSIVRPPTGNRAEQEQRADTGAAKLRLMLLQNTDDLVAPHLAGPAPNAREGGPPE